MRRKKILLLVAALLFFISIISAQVFAAQQSACYFCDDNHCLQASGSGWSGCVTGNITCGFCGHSCMSE